MLTLYRTLTQLAGPLIRTHLQIRRLHGKEDGSRIGERLGRPSRARPEGPLVWLHGASVGEALSILPLVERMLAERKRLAVMVTTGTVTSAALLGERLPERAFHQYVPIDCPGPVENFLDHWRPDLAVWVESELWPNLVTATHRSGATLVLIQARLSERALHRWQRLPGFARSLVESFSLTIAQSEAMAKRFAILGARDVVVANLKDSAPPLPADPGALAALLTALGGRPCWLAASTHPGEEPAIAAAIHALKERIPGLLTIVAPRHPTRASELERAFAGLNTVRRSSGTMLNETTDVYIADTIGELGLFYRLAPVAFIGGSLVPHGGQNPFEAVRLGAVALFGPHMANFEPMVDTLLSDRAAFVVADAPSLAAAVERLLANELERATIAARGEAVAMRGAHAIERVMAALSPWLDRIDSRPPLAPTREPGHARA
ncbi:MAG: 3-deoxy-D-manno-octulosonic acid transferase [Alphaproteobacteria bacterium]|nr:3-deoxy-D-manno-octulosonic acid transferase [Alphaproteobacteria bacterium]